MAKLRGSRLLFVSVGAGPIHSTLGRLLAKAVLSIADYRSYRDTSSMKYLQSIGFRTKDDRVYPDLVFGLPEAALPPAEDRRRRRPVVGLGLRSDSGKYGLASPSGDTYIGYLESLAVFVGWLLEHDYDVKLLLGDGDTEVIPEFKTVLRGRLGSFDENRVGYEETTSFEELLAQLSETAVVVATRFHNVVLSLLMNKPVIAISFHHKCESLMREMGVSEYCHDITHMDADALIRQFEKLVQNADDVRQAVEHGVEESRRALDEQYDLLFAGQADHSHAVHASTVAT
jgi:polysaccharide pyruvyl transferase WcaK-like protein